MKCDITSKALTGKNKIESPFSRVNYLRRKSAKKSVKFQTYSPCPAKNSAIQYLPNLTYWLKRE